MQKARRHTIKMLRPLVGVRFQELFHSAVRGAFHLSLTVLVRYRLLPVFSLGGWARRIHTGFLVSRATQGAATLRMTSCTGLTIYGETFQILPLVMCLAISQAYNPIHAVTRMVWALPRSLATTWEIIVIFSSYGY